METKGNNEEDSFIILGTSPGTSLDLRFNGVENCADLDNNRIEDALKDIPAEASMAFKAYFHIGDTPSPGSMMVASTIVTDDRSTEELQKRFGELLDENLVLRETLKQNNESLKDQLDLIASCQDDMLNTHKIHREKFDETKNLVKKLREENKMLKQDAMRLSGGPESQPPCRSEGKEGKSGASSGVEFVTSPDDDTIDKLTAQLELVEKQRRQVIVDNEKLTWQKESLEHIIDATSKERDEIKEKLKNLELQISNTESDHAQEVKKLHFIIQDLQRQLKSLSDAKASSEDVASRHKVIQQLEGKISNLQSELKVAQIKILDLENIKLEFMQHKSGVSETVRMYKEQIQELGTRLKDAQTTVFQPVRLSVSSESETTSPEVAGFAANVKLYDRTLKHLADCVNALTSGLSDSLVQTLGTVASLYDYKLERGSVDRFKSGLAEVKQQLERQHSYALNNIGKLRGTLSIFEGIFKDYNELVKNALTKPENQSTNGGVEALTSALVARGHELQQLKTELHQCKARNDDADLLRAQLQQYKCDFEAEREAREKMASEKDDLVTDLRTTQKRNQELTQQLDEVRKLSPGIYSTVVNKKAAQSQTPSAAATVSGSRRTTTTTTGNMVRKKKKISTETNGANGVPPEENPAPQRFTCPVCDQTFKTLIFLQQHVDSCLL